MSFRLLRYVCAAYQHHLSAAKNKGGLATLPYPLAVVLHHGKKPWGKVLPMRELIDAGPGVPSDILGFPIFLIDLARISGERLPGHPVVCAALDLLQSASTGDLAERKREIFGRLGTLRHDRRLGGWALSLGTYYASIQQKTGAPAELGDLAEILQPAVGKKEAKKMGLTIAESFIMQGEAKGKAEGKAETIIAVLEARFGRVPAKLKKKVAALRERKRLEHAVTLCATSESLKAFEKAL